MKIMMKKARGDAFLYNLGYCNCKNTIADVEAFLEEHKNQDITWRVDPIDYRKSLGLIN